MINTPGRLVDLGPGLQAHVAGEHPLDKYDLPVLASQLVQALSDMRTCEKDAGVFATRVNTERSKSAEMLALIDKLNAIRSGKAAPPTSRMDPLNTYDTSALRAQSGQHDRNALMFEKRANDARARIDTARQEADRLQKLIKQVQDYHRG